MNGAWIEIPSGSLPAALSTATVQVVLWQANETEFLLNVPGLARFWVQQGAPVQIERSAGTADSTIHLLLQGYPLAAYFVQRGHLTLHAAAVSTARGAIIIAGHSAAGKSTVAAALAARGCAILADEVTPLSISPAGLTVQPALPDLFLWRYAMIRLGIDVEHCAPVRNELERYAVPPIATENAPQPLYAIYLLNAHNSPEVNLEAVTGRDRFLALQHYAFNRILPQSPTIRRQQFVQLTTLLAGIRIQRIYRPRGQWAVAELVAAIEQDLCL